MLPSLGFQEILLLGILALVVVGPKDLPLMLRKLGRWTARLRGMANEFRSGFDELARQAELDELKKEVDALRRDNVLSDISREIRRPVDYGAIAPPTTPHDVAPHDVTHAAPDPVEPALPPAWDAPAEPLPLEAPTPASTEAAPLENAPIAADPVRSVS